MTWLQNTHLCENACLLPSFITQCNVKVTFKSKNHLISVIYFDLKAFKSK